MAGTIVFDNALSVFGSSGILTDLTYSEVLEVEKMLHKEKHSFHGELQMMRKDSSSVNVYSSHVVVKRVTHEPIVLSSVPVIAGIFLKKIAWPWVLRDK